MGSTRAVIDGSGTPVEAVSYDAYGAIIRSGIVAGNEEPTKEKFTGKEYDTSGFVSGGIACGLQLDYFGARYYDPEVGEWSSIDLAGQEWDAYGYSSNPVLTIDPDGLWEIGAGLLFGYSKEHGFNIGLGFSGDFGQGVGSMDVVYNFKDKSETYSAEVGGEYGIAHGSIGGSYNSKEGENVSASIGVEYYFVGAELGTSQNWNRSGNYMGGSEYLKGYVGSYLGLNIGGGYSWGNGGAPSGWFGDYNALGFNGRWDKNGYNWAFQSAVQLYSYQSADEKNWADLQTKTSGYGHAAIVGEYKGERFQISVGTTKRDNLLALFFGITPGANQCEPTGEMKPLLRGANVRALYNFSKLLDMAGNNLPFNAILMNCSFYTFLGMNLAGVNNFWLCNLFCVNVFSSSVI